MAIINPLKGLTRFGWHFEQQVYDIHGVVRTVKAAGGSGNTPKIIIPYEQEIRKALSTPTAIPGTK